MDGSKAMATQMVLVKLIGSQNKSVERRKVVCRDADKGGMKIRQGRRREEAGCIACMSETVSEQS